MEDSSFNSIFNNDQVLIGIVLGYGTQHSLFVGRQEKIMESILISQDVPPLYPKANLCDDSWKDMLLFSSVDENLAQDKKALNPSFGFASLKIEQEQLVKKMDLPSGSLTEKKTFFYFWMS